MLGLINQFKLGLIITFRLICRSWMQQNINSFMYMVALNFQRRDPFFLIDLPITWMCTHGIFSKVDSICLKQCSIGRTGSFLQYLRFSMFFYANTVSVGRFSFVSQFSPPERERNLVAICNKTRKLRNFNAW